MIYGKIAKGNFNLPISSLQWESHKFAKANLISQCPTPTSDVLDTQPNEFDKTINNKFLNNKI